MQCRGQWGVDKHTHTHTLLVVNSIEMQIALSARCNRVAVEAVLATKTTATTFSDIRTILTKIKANYIQLQSFHISGPLTALAPKRLSL